jgi:hypothetical protein
MDTQANVIAVSLRKTWRTERFRSTPRGPYTVGRAIERINRLTVFQAMTEVLWMLGV